MSDRTAILAVIVLYEHSCDESVAWRTLRNAIGGMSEAPIRFEVVLYDNSPSGKAPTDLPGYAIYREAAQNRGLWGAYTYALARAETRGFEWLLTLDQDTELPVDFLAKLSEYGCALVDSHEIGVIVPQLSEGRVLLSPQSVLLGRNRAVPRGFKGIRREEIHAFNSGALWRVSAIHQVGGFSSYFPLDHLDIWMHHQLYRAGYSTFIAGDLQLRHTLSLLDYKTRVSDQRYRGFLAAETFFCDLCRTPLDSLLLTARLCCRLVAQLLRGERKQIRLLTADAIRDRIFVPKRERIRRRESNVRSGDASRERTDAGRQRVSVCLAAFNGERYIGLQLRSILDQLLPKDEVIVVDDASTDRTLEEIGRLGDARLRIIRHEKTQGVVPTFEDAIRAARNEILFLSDQDDIWLPGKVSTILSVFAQDPIVSLVTTNVRLIDSSGDLLDEIDEPQARPFDGGFWATLLHNQYRGCTMAFRASLRRAILPLPANYDVLHDVWIGVRNRLSGGRSVHLIEPLVLYRRHAATVTGTAKLKTLRRIHVRLSLIAALCEFSITKSSM